HLAGVALKLDPRPATLPASAERRPRSALGVVGMALLLGLLLLTGVNLWATASLRQQLAAKPRSEAPPPAPTKAATVVAGEDARERFARAVYALLVERGARRELTQNQAQLLAEYERLAHENRDLHLADSDTEGKLAVGAIDVLAQRSADHVEELVRKA